MVHIRKFGQLEALDLSQAEKALIDACSEGASCKIANGELPPDCDNPTDDRKIRSSILRYLLLGGCQDKPIPICTVNLSGAVITETLDLDQQKLRNSIVFSKCRMGGGLSAVGAFIPALEVSHSDVSELKLDRVVVRNDVCLDGTVFSDKVCFSGAQIRGQLDCENAKFLAGKNHLAGSPDTPMYAFDGQDMRIGLGFFWKNVSIPYGVMDLYSAHVGVLVDDYVSWPDENRLRLNGFQYHGLANSPKDPAGRKKWLEAGSYWKSEFFPQPYTQLAKALRELGHDADARIVLEERERLLKIEARNAIQKGKDSASPNGFPAILNKVRCAFHYVFADKLLEKLIGYGHRPFRSLIALVLLAVIAMVPAKYAYEAGDFAPNSAVIQTSLGWRLALPSSNPAKVWSGKDQAGQDWETFSPIAYGIDVVVPIINFGQTDAWAPSTTRGRWGKTLWWLEWLLSTAGWIVTALGAAAITGLIRRD